MNRLRIRCPSTTVVTLLAILGAGGLSVAEVPPEPLLSPTHSLPGLFTLLDYYESGRRAVEAFLRQAPRTGGGTDLGEIIERVRPLCTRIEVRLADGGPGYRSVLASGVLFDGGRRVLTAGHSFEGGDRTEILVTLPGGETHHAHLAAGEYEAFGSSRADWAVLELSEGPRAHGKELELVTASEGDLAFILGYPDQVGVGADGHLAFDTGVAGHPLEPLITIAEVVQAEGLTLSPMAGSIPTGGMSGGPVFDSSGRLIGVFVAISRGDAVDGTAYSYRAIPTAPLRTLIRPR